MRSEACAAAATVPVGIVAKRDGVLVALTDTGQLAGLSSHDPWPQFAEWVADHTTWFWHRLADGQQDGVSLEVLHRPTAAGCPRPTESASCHTPHA